MNTHPILITALRAAMPEHMTSEEVNAAACCVAVAAWRESYLKVNQEIALKLQMQYENYRTNFGEIL